MCAFFIDGTQKHDSCDDEGKLGHVEYCFDPEVKLLFELKEGAGHYTIHLTRREEERELYDLNDYHCENSLS